MINWKVRFKNPNFWIQIALAIIVPLLGYAGLTAQDITSWAIVGDLFVGAISNPYVLITVAISVYNSITDPTVKGIGDSQQALTYDKPKEREQA